MNEHPLDTLSIRCRDGDFVQRLIHSRSTASRRRYFTSAWKNRNTVNNCIVVGLPFFLGLALGVPIAYFSLRTHSGHARTLHNSRAFSVSAETAASLTRTTRESDPDATVWNSFHSSVPTVKIVLETNRSVPVLPPKLSEVPQSVPVSRHSGRLTINSKQSGKNHLVVPISDDIQGETTEVLRKAAKTSKFSSALRHPQRLVWTGSAEKLENAESNSSTSEVFASSGTSLQEHPANAASKDENETSSRITKVVKGVYWTDWAEFQVPKGFDDSDAGEWHRFLNVTQVLKIEEGCGRMQNRLVTFDGGEKSCCRYRHNNDQIQGEIFSFYLGRLLGIANLLPSALALVRTRDSRWFPAASQVAVARWSPDHPVVLTKYVQDLQPEYIPVQLRSKTSRRLCPEDVLDSDVSQLVQWSDLIIFDYLTANLDRMVNNMYNERWNADMMKHPTHNLARTSKGLLLFLDNESGLLHGYRLLEKYEHFHRSLLDSLCVFRKKTVDLLRELHVNNNVDALLRTSFVNLDPGMAEWLPFLPDKSVKILKKRIATVVEHVQMCEAKYGRMKLDHL